MPDQIGTEESKEKPQVFRDTVADMQMNAARRNTLDGPLTPRRSWIQRSLMIFMVLAGTSVALGFSVNMISWGEQRALQADLARAKASETASALKQLQAQNDLLNNQIQAFQRVVREARVNGSPDGRYLALDARLKQLEVQVSAVANQQRSINNAILATPESALAIPLLRRDLENIKEADAQAIKSVKESVDQAYDLAKWLIGGVLFAMIALGLAQIIPAKKVQ